MREIKFRAWLLDESLMVGVDSINFEKKTISYTVLDMYGFHDVGVSFDKVALMQYTGLKDKNGREIYEGDILKSKPTPHLTVPFLLGVVSWENDIYSDGAPALVIVMEGNPAKGKQDLGYNSRRRSIWEEIEVIGNIYENPDLIPK